VSTRLSPIQGTPTKPEKTNTKGAKDSLRTSPAKTPGMTPRKNNVAATRRDNRQDKPSSKERIASSSSPSKIPLKKNKPNDVSLALNSSRFISMPEQSMEKPRRAIVVAKEEDGQPSRSVQNGRLSEPNSNGIDGDSGKVDQVHLMDLLKQTSQATSTSSEHLVNTTTTTAVQPLHIDANTLLVERNETTGNHQERDGTSSKSSISPASRDESSVVSTHNVGQKSMQFENQMVKSNQSSNPGNDKKDSPVGTEGGVRGHSKNSNQVTRNVAKMNGDSSAHQRSYNQSSANQRAGRNDQNARGVRPSDARPPEGSEMTSMTSAEMNSSSIGGKVAAGDREVPTSDKMPTMMKSEPKMARAAVEDEARTNAEATTMNSTTTMSNRTANNAATTTTTKSNNHANPAIGAVNASVNASGSAARTRNANRGSDASLKSSTGVSTDSIESVRSTDTGVSVNTVRGVSSPREKTGVHVVKRQEIETLSGNIVHIEQNGEPA